MKKILSLAVIALFVFSTSAIAQSNLTLVLKEKADNAYFKRTEFTFSFSGFTTQQEATSFYSKMKINTDVTSVQDKGKDANGNYNVEVIMKKAQDKPYYINWISKLGVAYVISVKGEKKTPQELLAAKENNHHKDAVH